MLRKVQPKVWWAALFAVVVIVLSWVWVSNSRSHDLVNFKRNAKSNPNLDPVVVRNPDAKMQAKIEQIQDIFRRKRNAGFNGNVLIVQKGKILYQNSFGYAHLKDKDSLQSHFKFQLLCQNLLQPLLS
jgi:CubicO group peptidase (beta-lactamase class C family)